MFYLEHGFTDSVQEFLSYEASNRFIHLKVNDQFGEKLSRRQKKEFLNKMSDFKRNQLERQDITQKSQLPDVDVDIEISDSDREQSALEQLISASEETGSDPMSRNQSTSSTDSE